MNQIKVDLYVLETLMRDLVEHEKMPSAFIVYLNLWKNIKGIGKKSVHLSLAKISDETGLSKSAVQSAIKTLTRRRLVEVNKGSTTAVPEYALIRQWKSRSTH
jgi:IclR helix-turn-helix domain